MQSPTGECATTASTYLRKFFVGFYIFRVCAESDSFAISLDSNSESCRTRIAHVLVRAFAECDCMLEAREDCKATLAYSSGRGLHASKTKDGDRTEEGRVRITKVVGWVHSSYLFREGVLVAKKDLDLLPSTTGLTPRTSACASPFLPSCFYIHFSSHVRLPIIEAYQFIPRRRPVADLTIVLQRR